ERLHRLDETRNESAWIEVVVLRSAEEFIVLNPDPRLIDDARANDPRVRPHIVISRVAESSPVAELVRADVGAKRSSGLVERPVRRPEETAGDAVVGSDVVITPAGEAIHRLQGRNIGREVVAKSRGRRSRQVRVREKPVESFHYGPDAAVRDAITRERRAVTERILDGGQQTEITAPQGRCWHQRDNRLASGRAVSLKGAVEEELVA